MHLKTVTVILCLSMSGTSVFAESLTITQRSIAQEMSETVLNYAILSRLKDMCANVVVDEAKLSAHRNHVVSLAQKVFSSTQDFMVAAGAGEKEKRGASMRRFFMDRGVKWTSSAKEYCELAQSLEETQSALSAYFQFRQ
ncbi:MAG: hypothetical protein ACK5JE_12945 [Castellaniella sp.]|uniref:hypothetical protein n=1 Tax=Castellaniella sp. TaxID=1955812 RepID=UPI003A852387